MPRKHPNRPDRQLTGLAGELFVAAELLKRGYQTSVTFGNAKAIDLLAFNARTGRSFQIQVKSLRKKTGFPIARKQIVRDHTYVFVVLNKPDESPQYFVVPGKRLCDRRWKIKGFDAPVFPGILPSALASFEANWAHFEKRTGVAKEAIRKTSGKRLPRR